MSIMANETVVLFWSFFVISIYPPTIPVDNLSESPHPQLPLPETNDFFRLTQIVKIRIKWHHE